MEPLEEQLVVLGEKLRVELQRRLRKAEFGPKPWRIPKPRFCVMEPKRSRKVLGWHSPKRWQQGFVSLNEIVLTPAAVGKGVFFAAEVLAHEIVHLANAVAGRDDTSRQGRYHNELFRTTATAMGLKVSKDSNYGWCETSLGSELEGLVRGMVRRGLVDAHVFRYQRLSAPKAQPSLVKLIADCGTVAYVPRSQLGITVLCCGRCGSVLQTFPMLDE